MSWNVLIKYKKKTILVVFFYLLKEDKLDKSNYYDNNNNNNNYDQIHFPKKKCKMFFYWSNSSFVQVSTISVSLHCDLHISSNSSLQHTKEWEDEYQKQTSWIDFNQSPNIDHNE